MSKIEKALNRASTERQLKLASSTEPVSNDKRLALTQTTSVEEPSTSSTTIALMQEGARRPATDLIARGIINPEMGETPTVKALRDIRTKILQRTQGRNCVLMVTALHKRSGTSFIALNLGAAFALDATKTALVIDCNLRNTSSMLWDPKVNGLTDYLKNPNTDLAKIIHRVGIERLRVIPAGSNSNEPGEYFTSTKMSGLLELVRARYPDRFVIIDAPPVLESADTQILGDLCDYVILVVPYGSATASQIERSLKAIDRNKLLGVVFNNEPELAPLANLMRSAFGRTTSRQ